MPDSLRSRDRLAEEARAVLAREPADHDYHTRMYGQQEGRRLDCELAEAYLALAALVESQAHEIAETREQSDGLYAAFMSTQTERDDLRQELVRAERRQTVYLDWAAGMREGLTELLDRHAAINAARERPAQQVFDLISAARAVLLGDTSTDSETRT